MVYLRAALVRAGALRPAFSVTGRLCLLGILAAALLSAAGTMTTGVICQGTSYPGTSGATSSTAACPASYNASGLYASSSVDISSGSPKLGAMVQVENFTPYILYAGAAWNDPIVYSHPDGSGTYMVSLDFEIKGTISLDPSPDPQNLSAWPQVKIMFGFLVDGTSGPGDWIQNGDGTWQGETTHYFTTAPHQFVTGQTYVYTYQLIVFAHDTRPFDSILADFSHTVSLVGGRITDLEGNPVAGITYSTESGLGLGLDGATQVPEPSSLALISGGCAALWLLRRRRGPSAKQPRR